MATILGDAKIRLSLDIEAAKRQLDELAQRGVTLRDRPEHEEEAEKKHEDRERGIQTTKNSPLRMAYKLPKALLQSNPGMAFQGGNQNGVLTAAGQHLRQVRVANARAGAGLPPAGQSAAAAFMANMSAGRAVVMGLQALLAAKAVKTIINTMESSSKGTAFLKGVVPGAATNAADSFASHISDQIIGLKAKFSSFGRAAKEEETILAAALRLGEAVPVGGAVKLYHFLQNAHERQERMHNRVEMKFDREIMEKLGQSIRQSMNR